MVPAQHIPAEKTQVTVRQMLQAYSITWAALCALSSVATLLATVWMILQSLFWLDLRALLVSGSLLVEVVFGAAFFGITGLIVDLPAFGLLRWILHRLGLRGIAFFALAGAANGLLVVALLGGELATFLSPTPWVLGWAGLGAGAGSLQGWVERRLVARSVEGTCAP